MFIWGGIRKASHLYMRERDLRHESKEKDRALSGMGIQGKT